MSKAADVERWISGALRRRGVDGYALDTFEESERRTDIAVYNAMTGRGHSLRFDGPFRPKMVDSVADFVAEKAAETGQ